jgi:hypothetical protein
MGGTSCIDCGMECLSLEPGVRTEYYMVCDDIWAAAGMGHDDGYLCIGCIEHRLGRPLHRADFTHAHINDPSISDDLIAWSWRTDRLRSRLTAPAPAAPMTTFEFGALLGEIINLDALAVDAEEYPR